MKPPDLAALLGRIFVSAESGEEFGPIRTCESFSNDLPSGWTPIATDSCGNYFLISASHGVAFWDHETGDVAILAGDWSTFTAGCVEEADVSVAPSQVVSVWVNPKFAAAHGLKVPR